VRGERYEVVRHVFVCQFCKSIFLKKVKKISRRPARQVKGERSEVLRHIFMSIFEVFFFKKMKTISRRPARQVRGERPEILRDALNVNAITA
jgi:hypothetical protein